MTTHWVLLRFCWQKNWRPLGLQKDISQSLEPFTILNLSLYPPGISSQVLFTSWGECISVRLEEKPWIYWVRENYKREDGGNASRTTFSAVPQQIPHFEKWKLKIWKLIPLKLSIPAHVMGFAYWSWKTIVLAPSSTTFKYTLQICAPSSHLVHQSPTMRWALRRLLQVERSIKETKFLVLCASRVDRQ